MGEFHLNQPFHRSSCHLSSVLMYLELNIFHALCGLLSNLFYVAPVANSPEDIVCLVSMYFSTSVISKDGIFLVCDIFYQGINVVLEVCQLLALLLHAPSQTNHLLHQLLIEDDDLQLILQSVNNGTKKFDHNLVLKVFHRKTVSHLFACSAELGHRLLRHFVQRTICGVLCRLCKSCVLYRLCCHVFVVRFARWSLLGLCSCQPTTSNFLLCT